MKTRTALASLIAALSSAPALIADCGPFFSAPRQIATGTIVPTDLHIVDLDGMQYPEIVYASRGSNNQTGITIFQRNNDGTYASIQFIPMPSSPPQLRLVVEDVTRDGILDLVVLEYNAGSARIFPGLGDSTFSTNGPAYAVGPTPTGIVMKDLNNDGLADLLVSNLDPGTVSVLMASPGGGFFPRATVPAGGNLPNWVGLTDFNGDGRDDLVTVVNSPSGVACSLGNGNGTFQTPRFTASPSTVTHISPVIQDMTLDGVPDVVLTDSSNTFFVFRAFTNATMTPVAITTDPNQGNLRGLAVGDFDSNGFPDVVALTGFSASPSNVMIYPNRPGLNFAPAISFGEYGGAISGTNFPVRVADINADGLADVVFSDRFGQIGVLEATAGGAVLIGDRPQNQTVSPGATVTFATSSPSTGVTFRWFKNGQPVINSPTVTGATTNTLTITNAQPDDAAVYECRITGPCDAKAVSAFLAVAGPINPCPADFDGDGFVDFFDLDAFIAAFEEGC